MFEPHLLDIMPRTRRKLRRGLEAPQHTTANRMYEANDKPRRENTSNLQHLQWTRSIAQECSNSVMSSFQKTNGEFACNSVGGKWYRYFRATVSTLRENFDLVVTNPGRSMLMSSASSKVWIVS